MEDVAPSGASALLGQARQTHKMLASGQPIVDKLPHLFLFQRQSG